MKYSVIDISSSSISMITAEVSECGCEIVFKDRESLTLMRYLEGKNLSRRGMEKLAEAVSRMMEKCASLGAQVLYVIATAALRVVENFEEIQGFLMEKTGIAVNLLEGKTEAYCDYIANRYYASFDRAVLVDIGGGSIEICGLSGDRRDEMFSLAFGIYNLHQKFLKKIQPSEEEAKEIKKYAIKKFNKAGVAEKDVYSTVVLVGATGMALYDLYVEYFKEKTEDIHRRMQFKKFKKLAKHLLTGASRSRLILETTPEKLYSVGIASVIVKELYKRFKAETLLVSDRGVKEGYLQLILEEKQRGSFFDFASGKCVVLTSEQSAKKEKKSDSLAAEQAERFDGAQGKDKNGASEERAAKAKQKILKESAEAQAAQKEEKTKKSAEQKIAAPKEEKAKKSQGTKAAEKVMSKEKSGEEIGFDVSGACERKAKEDLSENGQSAKKPIRRRAKKAADGSGAENSAAEGLQEKAEGSQEKEGEMKQR